MRFKKLKAGALQFTMFVTVTVALLLAGFILFVHTHKQFKLQTQLLKQTVDQTNKGMAYALGQNIPLGDTLEISLDKGHNENIKVHRSYWGLFEKVTISSKEKQYYHKTMALIGGTQQQADRTALYVADNNKPLVVVGNTKIQGTAYLPKQGIRTGNISGHAYYGKQLIYGNTKTSTNLPKLDQQTIESLDALPKIYGTMTQNQFIDLDKKGNHQNSFFDPLQIVYSTGPIMLSGVSLTGHIQVQSNTKITVDASAALRDVLLIAPEIEIKDHVKGNFQAIATEKLTIGKYCELKYPSALVLNDQTEQNAQSEYDFENQPILKLEQDTQVKGLVVYLGKTKNYKPQVFIGESVEVTGEVYCEQNLELLGTVNGSVLANNFIAQQSGSAYQNHIYNGTISIDRLLQEFVGLTFEHANKGIMQWLY